LDDGFNAVNRIFKFLPNMELVSPKVALVSPFLYVLETIKTSAL